MFFVGQRMRAITKHLDKIKMEEHLGCMQMWRTGLRGSDPGLGHIERCGSHCTRAGRPAWELSIWFVCRNKVRWILTGKPWKGKAKLLLFFVIALIKNLREEWGFLLMRKIKGTGLMEHLEASRQTDHIKMQHQEFFIRERSLDSVWVTQKEMMAEYIARGHPIKRALWKRWEIIEKNYTKGETLN